MQNSGLACKTTMAYLIIGYCCFNVYGQNIHIADSLINILQKETIEDDSLLYNIYGEIAHNHPHSDTGLVYAKKALKIANKMGNFRWMGYSHTYIGYSHKSKGNLYQALDSFLKGKRYYEKANNVVGVATLLNAIAGIYKVHEDYEKALSCFSRSIKILRSNNDSLRLSSVLLNKGDLLFVMKRYDSALFYFKSSLQIQNKLKYKLGLAYNYGNMGLVYAAQDKNDSAEYFINKATAMLRVFGDGYPIAVYQTYMADIYKDKGDAKRALKYAHNSLKIAEEGKLKEQIRDASLKLSELYRDVGNWKKAYHYQNQYIAYRDSINNEEVIRKMADLRTEYEVSKKQLEVNLLQQRNKTQTIINYILILVLLLILILAFITYKNSQKRKQINQVLSRQKEEIVAQRNQLEELLNMKDRFFGIISHDLRSPVNSLQGITRLLSHYVEKKQIDEVEEFVLLADKSINNLASLLDNLLNWALSQQGSLPYRPEQFKFYYVAEEVKRIFSNMAAAKKIELKVDVAKETELYGDRDSIFALTRNLVNNAIKFTREKGVVMLTASLQNELTRIVVLDTGIGIPKENLDQLFDLDKKKSTKGTAGEKGTGLGLALCNDIVALNKGTMTVESKTGEGTKFIILLPARKS